MGRLSWVLAAFVVAVLTTADAAPRQQAALDRYKAVFLYHFIGYVTWPDVEAGSDFRIGVLGNSEVTASLQKLVQTRSAGDRKLLVRTYGRLEDVAPCELLFVTTTFADSSRAIAARMDPHHTLTVTDAPSAPALVIRFLRVDDQLKFTVDLAALERAGLKASAHLLRLAIDTDS